MPSEETPHIEVIKSPHEVRWVLPPTSNLHPFRGPLGSRILSWIFIGVGVVFILFGASMAWKLHGKSMYFYPSVILNIIIIAGFVFYYLYSVVPGILMGLFMIVDAFPAHDEIVLTPQELKVIRITGIVRRCKRYAVGDIKLFSVETSRGASAFSLKKPLAERSASLLLEHVSPSKKRRHCIANKHHIVVELAQGLSRELVYIRPDQIVPFFTMKPQSAQINVVDMMDPAFLNEDDTAPPPDCRYRVESELDGLRITGRPKIGSVGQLFGNAIFRAGLWCVLMGVACFFVIPVIPLVLPPQIPLVFLGICCFYAAMIWAAIPRLCVYYSYRVAPAYLERHTHCLGIHWTRRETQTQIAAIRIGCYTGDKNRVYYALEILRPNGKKAKIASGDVLSLRFLGTHLRKAIQVPAISPQTDCLDFLSSAYHDVDQLESPAKCPVVYRETPKGVVLAKEPYRFSWQFVFAVGLFTVFGVAAVLLLVIAIPQVDPKDIDAVIVAACVCAGFFVLGMCSLVWETTSRYDLWVTRSCLVYRRKTVFRMTEKQYRRETLAAIRSECSVGLAPYGVMLLPKEGEPIKLLAYGKPEVARYVASQLRRVMELPAKVETPDQPAPETGPS